MSFKLTNVHLSVQPWNKEDPYSIACTLSDDETHASMCIQLPKESKLRVMQTISAELTKATETAIRIAAKSKVDPLNQLAIEHKQE